MADQPIPARNGVLRTDFGPSEAAAMAWQALLGLRRASLEGRFESAACLALDHHGELCDAESGSPDTVFVRGASGFWEPSGRLDPAARALYSLYLGIASVAADRPYLIGHLGQSLDGHIATLNGDSTYVTGQENIIHLHRMRALCSAVVVGASTVELDDPALTTRRVPGPDPARVVIDPRRRLAEHHRVFQDGAAPSWLVCSEQLASSRFFGKARVLGVPTAGERLDLRALVSRLAHHGLTTLFIEGGGNTVSGFLDAGLLDRMQIAVAPLLTGRGRPGLSLAARDSLAECLRADVRVFRMGEDILFDGDLRAPARDSDAPGGLELIY